MDVRLEAMRVDGMFWKDSRGRSRRRWSVRDLERIKRICRRLENSFRRQSDRCRERRLEKRKRINCRSFTFRVVINGSFSARHRLQREFIDNRRRLDRNWYDFFEKVKNVLLEFEKKDVPIDAIRNGRSLFGNQAKKENFEQLTIR